MKHTSLIFLWQPQKSLHCSFKILASQFQISCIAVLKFLYRSSKILHCSSQCFFLAVSNKSPIFVKILPTKNGNFGLTMRKRLFCDAKEPLLPCKTYAFGMQNNRFCKVLVHRWLCDSYECEKCLQHCGVKSTLWLCCLATVAVRTQTHSLEGCGLPTVGLCPPVVTLHRPVGEMVEQQIGFIGKRNSVVTRR